MKDIFTPRSLEEIYKVVRAKDFESGLKFVTRPEKDISIYTKALEAIINDTNNGTRSAAQIISLLSNFPEVAKVLRVFPYIGSGIANGNVSVKEVLCLDDNDPEGTKLAVIQSNTVKLHTNVRNANDVALFLSVIPTLELSRAVPYLDVQFQIKRNFGNEADRHFATAPSTLRFLEGAISLGKDTKNPDYIMGNALQQRKGEIGGKYEKKIDDVDFTDMSIFTSPQTLVPSNTAKGEGRAAEVIDRFRPFMSLEGVDITVVPTPVYSTAYKTMKMSLILHDRSRLSEISDFIRPAVYSGTSIEIEYGWSHPDENNENNVYGQLIKKMRLTEIYGITNSSFQFDASGQVKITLDLHMKGHNELITSKISESDKFTSPQKAIDEISEKISTLVSAMPANEKDPRAFQVLSSFESGEFPDTEKFKKDLKGFIKDLSARTLDESSQKLSKLLKDQSEKNGIKGFLEQQNKSKQAHIDDKFLKINFIKGATGKSETDLAKKDPFLPSASELINEESLRDDLGLEKQLGQLKRMHSEIANTISEAKGNKKNSVVSLAKTMLIFVGESLKATGKWSEIQFIYYPMNDYAGLFGGVNIGSFMLETAHLRTKISEEMKSKKSIDMSLGEFVTTVLNAFVANPRSINYGLRDIYKSPDGDFFKEPRLPEKVGEGTIANRMDAILKVRGKGAGVWKQPTLSTFIETLPQMSDVNPSTTGDANRDGKLKKGSDILRIHVYDQQSSSYDAFAILKNAQTLLQNAYDSKDKTSTLKEIENLKQLLKASGTGIIIDDKDGILKISATPEDIKKFVTQTVPTLTYGSNNTGIINATLQSIQDPSLNSINIIRNNDLKTTQPNGSGIGNLPLRLIPSKVDVNLFGCPLIHMHQQFFIDFGTNTSVDNFYNVNQVTHKLAPGKFETHAQLIPTDAYGVYENLTQRLKMLNKRIGVLGDTPPSSNTPIKSSKKSKTIKRK
jgi:hypothetical protein